MNNLSRYTFSRSKLIGYYMYCSAGGREGESPPPPRR